MMLQFERPWGRQAGLCILIKQGSKSVAVRDCTACLTILVPSASPHVPAPREHLGDELVARQVEQEMLGIIAPAVAALNAKPFLPGRSHVVCDRLVLRLARSHPGLRRTHEDRTCR